MARFRWSTFVAAAVGGLLFGDAATAQNKRVLFVTKSTAFQHSTVERKNGKLSLAERTVQDLGKKYDFEVDITKDGLKLTAENLKNYHTIFFYTQGDLTQKNKFEASEPMRVEDRPALLEFVRNGGGFVGTHCGGADTFNHQQWVENGKKPFIQMVGGEFIGHGEQQVARVEVVDPSFPAVKHWPRTFTLNDEWYAYDGFHDKMHVLQMLHTDGMKGKDYERPSYPITWCSQYGKGRVFYTGMGHREDVWENPAYQQMIGVGVQWTLGAVEGDATPNLQSLFGDADQALQRINPPGKAKKP